MAQYVWSAVYVDAMILRDRSTNGGASLNERLWVQQDADFNVTVLVNTSGSVTERSVVDPYGTVNIYDASWNTRSSSSYGWLHYFQGKRFDSTAGLCDFNARFYSPTLMRFVQNDPIGFAGGDQNLTRTEGNSPMSGLDPSGLESPDTNGMYWHDYASLPGIAWGLASGGVRIVREHFREGDLIDQRREMLKRHPEIMAQIRRQRDLNRNGNDSSVGNLWRETIEGDDEAWEHDLRPAPILAMIGIQWSANGFMWVTPSGNAYLWTSGRWVRTGSTKVELAGEELTTANAALAKNGYKNYDAFKRAMGPAGPGKVWHHIVEQRGPNIQRFGAETIHNSNNVIAVDNDVNQAIADYYASIPDSGYTGGLTVRNWLNSKSFAEQMAFGQRILKIVLKCGKKGLP
jgi:RHS repeat-associated protein